MSNKWASCSTAGHLNFNDELLALDQVLARASAALSVAKPTRCEPGERDPVSLAIKRAMTFWNRKSSTSDACTSAGESELSRNHAS